MDEKKNRLLINMTSYAVLQLVNILVGLFLPRLYLAVYGSEINGVVSTVNSFISYFSYLEAGLGLTMIHSLFKPLANQDFNELNGLLSFAKNKYKRISYIYFILVLCVSFVFPIVQPSSALGSVEFFFLVLVIGLYGAVDFYSMAKYRVLLTADRKEFVISNAMIIAQIVRFIFVWILLRFNISVVIVKIAPVLTLAMRSLILNIYVRKKYPHIDFSAQPSSFVEGKNQQYDALLLQVSISTSVSLPTIIISHFLGFKEANVYAVYSLAINAIIQVISALSSGVSPMLGRSIAQKKNIEKTYDLYDYIVSYAIAVCFSTTVIMLLPFVKLYTNVVNDTRYLYYSYAILISIWAAVYSYRIPVTAVVNAAAIYTKNRWSNFINLAIQIFLGIIGTIFWGIPGLLIVMILAALHRNISLSVKNASEVLHNGIKKSIIRHILIVITVCVSYLIAGNFVLDRCNTFLSWVIFGGLTFIIELICCGLIWFAIDYKVFKQCKEFVFSKFHR